MGSTTYSGAWILSAADILNEKMGKENEPPLWLGEWQDEVPLESAPLFPRGLHHL